MKYKILIFIVLASTLLVSAQDRLMNPEMYLGVDAGVTESQVAFTPTVGQRYLMGINGGLVFRYIAEKNVGMQAELNFSQRGWAEYGGLYMRQLNYIELPFMTHIYMGKRNRFFINLGPKISYLLSENVLLNNSGTNAEQHITSVQHPFDYGLCGGIGILFGIGSNQLQLDTRFNFGLSDIYNNSKLDYFSNSNNLNLSVNLAWLLRVK